MLKLILGRAGSGKTSAVMADMADKVRKCRGGQILLVPEQYSHEAERELCRVCGDSLSLYAEVLSFTGLCRRVESELGGSGKKQLDKGGKLLCMTMAVCSCAGALKVYQTAGRKPEMQQKLLLAVEEMKSACVSADKLTAAAERVGGALSEKLRDLALIMEAYDAFVSRSAADPSDRIGRLAENIRKSRVCGGHFYIDGFSDFTKQELEVITALIAEGADVTVCLTCDGLESGNELFETSRQTARYLKREAAERGEECLVEEMAPVKSGRCDALAFVEENLFGYTSEVFDDAQEAVTLLSAENAEAECALAAARARELAMTTSCRWRDIAVAVRGFDDYRPALERAFEKWEVPLFVGRREDMMKKSLPTMITSAMDTVTGGWEYEDIFTYLKTGLAGLTPDECDVLENYVILWDIRGSAWTRPGEWTQHPDGYGGVYDDKANKALETVNRLRRRAAGPLERLAENGRKAATASEQAAALSAFLLETELPLQLSRRAAELSGAGRETESAEYSQLWSVAVSALEQSAAVLGDTPMNQEEFARLYKLVLSQYDIGAIPASLDRVLAGDFDRMRRRHIKHLIVLGASDDRLPHIADDGGIFSDADRQELAELEIDLGSGEENIFRELNLIYSCLTLPRSTLTVSSPVTGSGGECRASFVVERLSALFGKKIKPFDREKAALLAGMPAFELAVSSSTPVSTAAAEYFRRQGMGARMELLRGAGKNDRGRLSPESVFSLYGDRLRISATRAEAFASCPFAYFMRYGMKAKPRKQAGFEAPEMGTFMHYVLENVSREISGGEGFHAVSEETVTVLADKYVEEYIHRELGDFREKSPRFIYLFRRLITTVRQVALDMVRELKNSDFRPLDFELDFADREQMPPVFTGGGKVQMTGIADRVDGWVHEGKLYLRVVDYKTGKKAFSLADVYSGMGLQMLLYLFALADSGKERYGVQEIVPAGVLYMPARNAVISASGDMTEDALSAEKAKKLRRSGLILNNEAVIAAMEHGDTPRYIPVKMKNGVPSPESLASAEQLGALARHIDGTLARLAEELSGGGIDAKPWYKNSQENACRWCEFASVCRFDPGTDEKRCACSLTTERIWQLIEGGQEEENGV